MAPEPEGVDGKDRLLVKRSAVDRRGQLRQTLIDGVHFRPTRPVPHEDGTFAEVARTDWPEVDQPIVHIHVTTTNPTRSTSRTSRRPPPRSSRGDGDPNVLGRHRHL